MEEEGAFISVGAHEYRHTRPAFANQFCGRSWRGGARERERESVRGSWRRWQRRRRRIK
jgi:hypothetical protein